MNAIHAAVAAASKSGAAYHATDPALLLWVHATLVDTALRVYGRYVAPLTPEEEQVYHAEARQVASAWDARGRGAADLVELRAEMARMMADGTVRVDATARAGAVRFYPALSAASRVGHGAPDQRLGAARAIRRGYGIPWSPAREARMRRAAGISRRVVPLVPPIPRRVPRPTAERRAAGSAPR